ncbi:zinc finger family protein [Dorcoceras hygrometricum]|uniref:Zinc finger family protein n=1 Tax=Dorcoceras hygrometricum TaxID=472368 RepID=A0A2Z7AYN2_9LAMI|nr:zinc finger family protein [Dorcoceras hygrometricum]
MKAFFFCPVLCSFGCPVLLLIGSLTAESWKDSENSDDSLKILYYHEGVRAMWLAAKGGEIYLHPYDVGVYENLTTDISRADNSYQDSLSGCSVSGSEIVGLLDQIIGSDIGTVERVFELATDIGTVP